MKRFKQYVDILDHGGGMSEDEPGWRSASRKKPRDYFVVRPVWRSQEVTNWLRVMDHVYLAQRFTPDGRVTRGSWVRDRKPSNKVDHTAAPIKGLPANFYDKAWLRSLPNRDKRRLKMGEAIDLTHTEEMIRCVSRYLLHTKV
jgi:hypothetical protein